MYWIRTNLQRFQPLNIKEMFIPHYIMEYVGSAVLVSYVNSQKGEFVIVGHTRLLYVCLYLLYYEKTVFWR